jgi:hypothetical protein
MRAINRVFVAYVPGLDPGIDPCRRPRTIPRRRLEENSLPIPCQQGIFSVMAILRETSARPRSLSRHLEDERAEPLYLDLHRIAWIGIFGLDKASEKYERALPETQAS